MKILLDWDEEYPVPLINKFEPDNTYHMKYRIQDMREIPNEDWKRYCKFLEEKVYWFDYFDKLKLDKLK